MLSTTTIYVIKMLNIWCWYACIIDSNIMAKSGKITIVADLAKEYNFTENDGK